MNRQNIYDDNGFFESYKQLRSGVNANEIVEIPALFEMLPPLSGLRILDLGCGYGEHCVKYIEMGADKVVGIDISEKMLQVAINENSSPQIIYKKLYMEDLSELNPSFDLIVSSLALHYIEDFKMVAEQVYRLLNNGGKFIFSQEHPFSTSFTYGNRWTKDENGKKLYANISNYSIDGKRESRWFKDGVIKYHRTFSSIINTLIESGFCIEQMSEPIPSELVMNQYPDYLDNIHKPDFLLIRAKKLKK
ncbi:MAG: class I SAM-dependent methyltransferase [Sedimentibacter sp.]|uniref:class I SAM-dependent DNA methyltransferase n=1 Tax=Sedimentibacter sp. TaxID=1960295 RepID=UPI00315855C8